MLERFSSLSRTTLSFLRRPEGAIPALIGLFHFWLMLGMSDGNLFNSYPYISDDGFDWITQGLALNQLVTGADTTPWPVLRSPVFVLITLIDQIFGSRGIVVMLVQSVAVAGLASLAISFTRSRGFGSFTAILVGLATYLAISSYFHIWILSDSLASCLMAFSAVASIRCLDAYQNASDGALPARSTWAGPIALAGLAGLTQTYGLIPILVIGGTYTGGAIIGLQSRRVILPAVGLAVVSAVIVFGGKMLWEALIPHNRVPAQFGLLKFDFAMLSFYREVWPLYFGAMVPTVLVTTYYRIRYGEWPRFSTLALAAVCLAFAVLSVLYHWADARFTFIYFTLAWLTLVSFASPTAPASSEAPPPDARRPFTDGVVTAALSATAIASICAGIFLTPANYWEPKLGDIRISLHDSWINAARREPPRDRYHLATSCESTRSICPAATYDQPWSPYAEIIFAEYKRRQLVGEAQPEGLPAPAQ